LLGVQSLADRLVREAVKSDGAIEEALLTLADFLIVLREVKYQPANGALSAAEFNEEFQSFLVNAAGTMWAKLESHQYRVAEDLWGFWERVVEQCVGQSN